MPEQSRQLAAIMFTDIVGYTALMGEDEQRAFELLKKNRLVQRPIIEKYKGRWLKEIGDGVLASFNAVSDAVYCAKAIQEACLKEDDLKLRIGIHLGEVVFEGDDVFGDGVNIASRLEPLAPIGGILVSESVFRNIENKKGIETEFLREETLKNVKHPVKIYQVEVEGVEAPDTISRTSTLASPNAPGSKPPTRKIFHQIKVGLTALGGLVILGLAYMLYDNSLNTTETAGSEPQAIDKSIAVIPFVNMSNDPEQEYFSDGMMEEILNHLVKIRDLQVISRTSVMRYKGTTKSSSEIAQELGVATILEGSVRKAGDRVRITQLWSESYDRKMDDVFAIQSEVAQQVASTLDAQIQSGIIERMDQMPTQNMEAYDLYLKALNLTFVADTNQIAREWLNQAIQLDSNFATAYALLGNSIIFQAGFTNNKNPSDIAAEGKAMLERALLLDPLDGIAHARMGGYYLWYEKDFNKAEIEYLTALRLAPSQQQTFYLDFLLAEGRFEEAISVGTKVLEIGSNNPANWGRNALLWAFNNEGEKMNESIRQAKQVPYNNILAITESARAYLVHKQYDQVLEILDLSKVVQQIPRVIGLKSIAYYKTGDIENHNKELNALIQKSTETAGGSPSFYIAMIYSSKSNIDEAFRWLEKSFQDNEIELYWLKVEPEFEPLRSDPRWQEMLDKVGFPEC